MTGKWNSDFKFSPTPGAFDFDHRSVIFWAVVLIGLSMIAAVSIPPDVFGNSYKSRMRVSRVQADQRSLAIAIESYYADHKTYPAWGLGMYGLNHRLRSSDPEFMTPTFMIPSPNRPKLATMTTPVSYLANDAYVTDPYAPTRGAHYGYWSDGKGWILYSAGPDRSYEINPAVDYNSSRTGPLTNLINKTYDATNGTKSAGDVYKVKQ